MDFTFTPQQDAFRQEVRDFLAEHNPPRDQRDFGALVKWWKAVREKRYELTLGLRKDVKPAAGARPARSA